MSRRRTAGRAELVLLALAVALTELAALAVKDPSGQPVALLLDVDLGAHAPMSTSSSTPGNDDFIKLRES